MTTSWSVISADPYKSEMFIMLLLKYVPEVVELGSMYYTGNYQSICIHNIEVYTTVRDFRWTASCRQNELCCLEIWMEFGSFIIDQFRFITVFPYQCEACIFYIACI